MNIVNVPIDSIREAKWRATHMLRPDLKLLTKSMIEYGWLSPIIVRKKDSCIIDGFHRWVIAKEDKEFKKQHGNKTVPVIFVDVDNIDAMVMHIRLNRTRGQLMARYLSGMVNEILSSRKFDRKELRVMLSMSEEEISVLMNGSLLKHRNVAEHEYSKAWVPVEVPAGAEVPTSGIAFETPPNADR